MFAEIIDIYIAKHLKEIDKMRETESSASLIPTHRYTAAVEMELRNSFLTDLRTLRESAAILERDVT